MAAFYRPSGFLFLIPFICLIWILAKQPLFDRSHVHRITDADISVSLTLPRLDFSSRPHHEYYASDAAKSLCAAHGYSVFRPRADAPGGRRKIYDLFMVNTELDFLEIRLKTLYDHVDYFVIVEAPLTFAFSFCVPCAEPIPGFWPPPKF